MKFSRTQAPAALGPADADLDWFIAHPGAVVRLRPAVPGEIEAQVAMHAASGGEFLRLVPAGWRGGWIAAVAVERVLRPQAPLVAGAWLTLEVFPVPDSHRRVVATAALEVLAGVVPVPARAIKAALARQFDGH